MTRRASVMPPSHVMSGCRMCAAFLSKSCLKPHLVYSCSPVVNMTPRLPTAFMTSSYPSYASGGRNSSIHVKCRSGSASRRARVML
eukprot:Skav236734  [mRNA]  locus=scaffold3352:135938:138902:- [translate_table: standard]